MAKYLKLFKNHQDFDDFTKTCDYVHRNVSVCESNIHVHYDEWHVGDILHSDGTVSFCPIEGKTPIAILVIPPTHTDDGTYRFMSIDELSSAEFDSISSRVYPIDKVTKFPIIDENGEFLTWGGLGGSLASKGEPILDQGYTYDFFAGNWYHHKDADPKPYAPAPFLEDGSKNPIYYLEPESGKSIFADMNGYEKTQILWEFDGENLPPVKFCKEYAPGFHDGEWYVPTVSECAFYWYDKVTLLGAQRRRAIEAAGKHITGLAEIWTCSQAQDSTIVTYYNTNRDGEFGTHFKHGTKMSTVPFLKIKKEK